ncbi:MAG TPA: serine/threonine-protein kinase [Thermodesulfobacteriota bacterium]|nr:serine/threonine-protein kinase [Thermodesulfobacteriota bacterium]
MIHLKELLAKLGAGAHQSPEQTICLGPADSPPEDLRDKIGKYEIISEIARGAMGVVLLGYDPYIKRNVAVKIISPARLQQIEDLEAYKSRFFMEAQAAGNLYHPNIVAIYDANEIDDLCMIVMEYVPGKTLEALCHPNQPASLEQIVSIGIKICHALDYAHQRQIIHRDVKPGNILITSSEEVKITDFGIASMPSCREITEDTILGTPYYLSPEQIKGDPASPASDFFSLGIVLYELITGKRPFEGSSLEGILCSILTDEPSPLDWYRENVPLALENVLRKALDKNVKARYQDGIAFALDLKNSLKANDSMNLEPSLAAKVEQLRNLLFFKEFSTHEVEGLLRISSWMRCKPTETIVHQDEMDTSFYIIISGTVWVESGGKPLAVLHRGDCFGELAFLRRKQRMASVIAHQDCQLLKISDIKINLLPMETQLRTYQSLAKITAEKLVTMDMRYLNRT